jgi:hypothetical protein
LVLQSGNKPLPRFALPDKWRVSTQAPILAAMVRERRAAQAEPRPIQRKNAPVLQRGRSSCADQRQLWW